MSNGTPIEKVQDIVKTSSDDKTQVSNENPAEKAEDTEKSKVEAGSVLASIPGT